MLAEMPFAGSSCIVDGGDRVTITDSSGNALDVARLAGTPVTKRYPTGAGSVVTERAYRFSATVAAKPGYRITVESGQMYFVSEAQFEQGVSLNC